MHTLPNLQPQEAQQLLCDLNAKLTEDELDHPGTAWYLSELTKISNQQHKE